MRPEDRFIDMSPEEIKAWKPVTQQEIGAMTFSQLLMARAKLDRMASTLGVEQPDQWWIAQQGSTFYSWDIFLTFQSRVIVALAEKGTLESCEKFIKSQT